MACLLGALLRLSTPARAQEGLGLTESPVLVIEAPPALEPVADRVRGYDTARLGLAMRLTGLTKPGGPIRVALAQEGSGAARSAPTGRRATRTARKAPSS